MQHYEMKNHQNVSVCFLSAICCWAHSLPSTVVNFPTDTPLGKTKLSFTGDFQLEMVSG